MRPLFRLTCTSLLFTILFAPGCDGDAPATDAGPLDDAEAPLPDAGPAGGSDAGVEPECTDECAAGSQSCDGAGQYRVCGQYDLDPCLEPSPPILCADGYECASGICAPPCRDECPVGGAICMGEAAVLRCGNFDTDACREPGGAVPCESSQRCEAGRCEPLGTACSDECDAEGATVCFGDAVRTCGQHDSDDCLDLGPPAACGPSETCGDGACVPYCTHECAPDARQCVGDGFRTCGQHDADACREWGPITACEGGQSCSAGACSDTCTDECDNPGGPVCTPDGTGVATCGEYDSDPCRDLSSAIYCPLGFDCQSGVCVASCTNDCATGSGPRCGTDGASVQTCGDFDDDVCYEWGGDVACPGEASCVEGACDTPCTDECSPEGSASCVPDAEATRTCGQYDLDACLEWSSPSACAGWESCAAGTCELGSTPAEILINELAYDSVGADGDPGNTIFIELWGPPGTSLDGWEVVGVDGNSGSDYNRMALDGQAIGPDGWFLIAHPDATSAITSQADLTSTAADLQNGPDSLQLRWRGRVVDALGYGSFATATFAGEGSPSPLASPGESLTRDVSHGDTDDNAADFSVTSMPSPRLAELGCSDECTEGTQCSGSQIQTCGDHDSDPCREWSAPADCPTAGHVCAAGACGPPSCTDECTAGSRQCSGAQLQTCGDYDGDACLEWSGAAACPGAGEEGSGAGNCAVPCTDECSGESTRCSGAQVQTCGDHDADACREWSEPADCPSGEVCSGTACRDEDAPEVVLISPMGTLQSTQGATHRMVVDATPAPGRSNSTVRYFADGALVGTTEVAPHELVYTVPPTAPTGATIALHATATDDAGSVGSSQYAYLSVQNDVPVASFTATITNVSTVTVDAGASTDTETPSEMLEVCWDWDDDGTCDTAWSTTKIASHDYGASGTFTIGMKVRDTAGQVSTATRTVTFTDIQYVGGVTLTSTLWYGTVIITGDVTLAAGETLTIAPGTSVLFVKADVDPPSGVGDYSLFIEGALVVNGTAEEPVIFSGQGEPGHVPGAWDRIRIRGAEPSTITHAIIEYADVGLEIQNGSTLDHVTVRSTLGDCILLDGADGATLTDSTTTTCGGDGVDTRGGSAGVTMTRHTSTANGGDGLAIIGSSSVAASGETYSNNGGDGASVGRGSTLDLSDAVVEGNAGMGLSFTSSAGGVVLHNQIRTNGREGVGLRSDANGQPAPVVNENNIYSNAVDGSLSLTHVDTSGTLSASYTCCGGSDTSSTYSAPAGQLIDRVYVAYDETDTGSNYVRAALLDGSTGGTLNSFGSDFSGWVYLPDGVTSLRVWVYDGGASYNSDGIVAREVVLTEPGGASDVTALTETGTADFRYNYLGTFPNVLSRVSMSRTDALNLQGFVGVLYEGSWDRGPYRAGPLATQTWSGTIYVTGDVTIAAGETLTVEAGTQVLFVDHDQDGDGRGDFTMTASGPLNATGSSGAPVLFSAYGVASPDAYQSIALAGSGADRSVWDHVDVDHGLNAVTITGDSSLSNVAVTGGAGDGITIRDSSGATLSDVTVTGAGDDGIYVRDGDGVTLTRVTSESNHGDGLHAASGSADLAVSRAWLRLNGGVGARIATSSSGSMTDSTIRDNTSHGVLIDRASPTVDYNLITYNGGAGIWIEGDGSASAEYNVIKYNDDAGYSIWSTTAGSPTPTLQYSNVYGNAIVGTSWSELVDTSSTLSAEYTCCGGSETSSTYTAPADHTIRRVHVRYDETDTSSGYVRAALIDGTTGGTIRSFSSDFTGWVFVPDGVTELRVWLSDGGASYTTDTIVGGEVELERFAPDLHYELAASTHAGITLARYNYWTSDIASAPDRIHQSRSGSVDYTGFTGLEYPSGSVTQVGPRP